MGKMPVKKWENILTIVSGKNQKDVEVPNGQFPIYGSGGVIGRASAYLCDAGTTIIGRKGTINSPIFVNEKFWNVDTAFGLFPNSGLEPKYLFFFCQYFNFKELDKSTTIPSLAKRDLLQIEMPVPPLEEQRRIVARIEELFSELDAAVATLKRTKEQLSVYRQAVLKEAFDGDYPRVQLQSISRVINGYAFKSKYYSDDGEYTIIKIGNVKPFYLDFTRDNTKTNEFSSALEKYTLKNGDCLITLTGSRGKRDYGFVTMLTSTENYLLNQRVAALRFNENVALPSFFQYYLSSQNYRREFFSYETGNVGQGNVSVKALKEPFVILPSIHNQEKIVSEIESRLSICNKIEETINTALQEAEAMRQSILKRAFAGEL